MGTALKKLTFKTRHKKTCHKLDASKSESRSEFIFATPTTA
jgi:hypothetical protein